MNHTFADLWISHNRRWKIVKRRYAPGPYGFDIQVHYKGPHWPHYEQVTPFDLKIPNYVNAAWDRCLQVVGR
jgi:hypothetical protein